MLFRAAALFSFPRLWPALGLSFVALGWGGALFSQEILGLEPCPLCIAQRAALTACGAFLLAQLIVGGSVSWLSVLSQALSALFAAAGAGVAARHLWIVHFPPPASCGADFSYLMDSLPLSRWLPLLFSGEGECSEAGSQAFLGLSLPSWSILLFACLLAGQIAYFGFRRRRIA